MEKDYVKAWLKNSNHYYLTKFEVNVLVSMTCRHENITDLDDNIICLDCLTIITNSKGGC